MGKFGKIRRGSLTQVLFEMVSAKLPLDTFTLGLPIWSRASKWTDGLRPRTHAMTVLALRTDDPLTERDERTWPPADFETRGGVIPGFFHHSLSANLVIYFTLIWSAVKRPKTSLHLKAARLRRAGIWIDAQGRIKMFRIMCGSALSITIYWPFQFAQKLLFLVKVFGGKQLLWRNTTLKLARGRIMACRCTPCRLLCCPLVTLLHPTQINQPAIGQFRVIPPTKNREDSFLPSGWNIMFLTQPTESEPRTSETLMK